MSASFDAMAEAVQRRIQTCTRLCSASGTLSPRYHELKTPMTSMMGYAGLLRTGPQTPDAVQDAAGYIYRETRRLEALCAKLLELLGLEAGEGSIAKAPVSDRALFAAVQRALAGPGAGDARRAGCVRARRVHGLRGPYFVGGPAAQSCRQRLPCLPRRARRGRAGGLPGRGGPGCLYGGGHRLRHPPEDLPRVTEPFYWSINPARGRAAAAAWGWRCAAALRPATARRLRWTARPGRGTTVTCACRWRAGRKRPSKPQRRGRTMKAKAWFAAAAAGAALCLALPFAVFAVWDRALNRPPAAAAGRRPGARRAALGRRPGRRDACLLYAAAHVFGVELSPLDLSGGWTQAAQQTLPPDTVRAALAGESAAAENAWSAAAQQAAQSRAGPAGGRAAGGGLLAGCRGRLGRHGHGRVLHRARRLGPPAPVGRKHGF